MELNTKQKKILDVAEKLFAENGFDGTSVRTIAQEANINIAMISYYFGSKEKLLGVLISERISDSRQQMEAIISGEQSYLEKMEGIVIMLIKRIHKNHRIHRIANFEYCNDSRKLDFQNFVQGKKENYLVLQDFISEGQKAGVFSKNIAVPLIIPTILGTYFYFQDNKPFYMELHGLKSKKSIDDFIHGTLTEHIQKTIKALLTYEN